jgi:DNA repair protein RecO (recombination protein O)
MASTRRVQDELGFVLHRHDWSETSLILDVFSRQYGRVVLVAKGAKRPTSQLRPVLLPLQPLLLSWSGDGDVRTLKTAQWRGGHVMPVGESLLAGIYLNELLLRLLPRDDPHPLLFDAYLQAAAALAQAAMPAPPVLRAFELMVLREAGYLPDLSQDGHAHMPLQADARYGLEPDHGLVLSSQPDRPTLDAAQWTALQQALDVEQPFMALIDSLSAPLCSALQPVLRGLLQRHCGVTGFKTRQLVRDVQAMARQTRSRHFGYNLPDEQPAG